MDPNVVDLLQNSIALKQWMPHGRTTLLWDATAPANEVLGRLQLALKENGPMDLLPCGLGQPGISSLNCIELFQIHGPVCVPTSDPAGTRI
jgi:hypothetical protein